MPGYIKIGFTTNSDVGERLKQLDRTGVPLPFEIHYKAEVLDVKKDEEWLHSIFADRRIRDNREFFKMSPELATLALKRIQVAEVKAEDILTEDQEKEVDEIKERRSRFYFKNYGISVGEKLTFTRDQSIVAEVEENNKIKIGDKIDSLSNFARDLLGYERRPQGTLYFMYQGEILDNMRRRMEDNTENYPFPIKASNSFFCLFVIVSGSVPFLSERILGFV